MKFRPNKRHSSQQSNIENALVRGESITPIEALKRFGIFRLSAIIFNLREKGYNINTKMAGNGNKRFAEYSLES